MTIIFVKLGIKWADDLFSKRINYRAIDSHICGSEMVPIIFRESIATFRFRVIVGGKRR